MELSLNWTEGNATSCGYRIEYRRKGEASYKVAHTSGTTITIPVSEQGCFEGLVKGDCCGGSYSTGLKFGVNCYNPVTVTFETYDNSGVTNYRAHITSEYKCPYDMYLTGTFRETCAAGFKDISFTLQYDAQNTSQYQFVDDGTGIFIEASCATPTISGIVVTDITMDFENGGLQHSDSVNTPDYCLPYWDTQPSWDGSPLSLPSVTADSYTGNTTSGNLTLTYIQDEIYNGADSPFDEITFTVLDDEDEIGSTTVPTNQLGLRTVTIALTKETQDLDADAELSIKTTWPNLDDDQAGNTISLKLPL